LPLFCVCETAPNFGPKLSFQKLEVPSRPLYLLRRKGGGLFCLAEFRERTPFQIPLLPYTFQFEVDYSRISSSVICTPSLHCQFTVALSVTVMLSWLMWPLTQEECALVAEVTHHGGTLSTETTHLILNTEVSHASLQHLQIMRR
jgi:hypothetical protein